MAKFSLFLLLALNYCNYNTNDHDIASCYRVNGCDIAPLSCMANYQLITNKSDYPVEICIYSQISCKQFCRNCADAINSYRGCETDRYKFLNGINSISGIKEPAY